MIVGGGGGPAAAAAPAAEAPPAAEKTHFDVKLKSFDAAQKLKVIKEVRAVTNLGLKEVRALGHVSRGIPPRERDRGCVVGGAGEGAGGGRAVHAGEGPEEG